VDAHLATYDQTGAISGIDDRSIISIVVKAIQQLANTVAGFADNFVSAHITATTIDAANGHFSDELCVGSTCVTPAQFQAMVAASSGGSTPPPPNDSNPQNTPDTTPPVITINGDNPAHINVGDTYSDLGATITAPQADLNLGVHTFVGTTPIDQAVIDTSTTTVYHINYVVLDQYGLTSTSTRMVIVEALFSTTSSDAVATSSIDAAGH
jgi:hypothetical protein